ncbi:hypothetical protein L228DRAFT_262424 [Xylona heveae TC161]|uniref:Protein transport protein sec16 n=1 Tax=Xylona heveae (strain CBS 132557 / TC161) TaxID=1328760 RepID=A0A165FUP1_XYLHT|nr:hypothetical protein L228DRAFT_262424 [Xylona heveae TC161]KZF21402.1 hypothetical protein L228DRAFT_262424 [Xylona heveae TC161]
MMDGLAGNQSASEVPARPLASSWHPAWRPDSDRDIQAPSQPNNLTVSTPAQNSPHLSIDDSSIPRNISSVSLQPHSFHVEDVEDSSARHEPKVPTLQRLSRPEVPALEDPVQPDAQTLGQSHGDFVVPEREQFPSVEPDIAGPIQAANGKSEACTQAVDPQPTRIEEATAGTSHRDSHASSNSFARTVSHEVIVGDDDEFSPQSWELPRQDTDVFKHLDAPDRSNSFPEVLPLRDTTPTSDITYSQPDVGNVARNGELPESSSKPDIGFDEILGPTDTADAKEGLQDGTTFDTTVDQSWIHQAPTDHQNEPNLAEGWGPGSPAEVTDQSWIRHAPTENQNELNLAGGWDPESSKEVTDQAWIHQAPVDHQNELNLAEGWAPESSVENDWKEQNSFDGFDKTHGTEISELSDAGVRFEEGVPLIPSDTTLEQPPEEEKQQEEPDFFAGTTDDADDFFKSTMENPKTEDDFTPSNLQRKSTSQVLGSLQYPAHSDTHPEDRATDSHGRSSASATFAGSINAQIQPPSTESRDAGSGSLSVTADETGNTSKSKEEALTEMWAAALDEDELLEDNVPDEGEKTIDPAAFFQDDGEGFLDEEPLLNVPQPYPNDSQAAPENVLPGLAQVHPSSSEQVSNRYTPATASPQSTMAGNIPGAASRAPSLAWTEGFAPAPSTTSPAFMGDQDPRPAMPSKAQSFADKSKGGYSSPYDLPGDVLRPKKRAAAHQVVTAPGTQPTPPPPRSSSMHPFGIGGPTQTPPPPNRAVSSFVPPANFSSVPHGQSKQAQLETMTEGRPTLKPKPSTSSFFEEIPIVPRSRPTPNAGRITPQAPSVTPPLSAGFVAPPVPSPPPVQQEQQQQQQQQQPPVSQASTSGDFGLRPAERVNPYAAIASSPPLASSPPSAPITSRYSPAPPGTSGVLKAQPKYAQPPPPPAHHVLPFQPRTSSPLASHERPQSQRPAPQQPTQQQHHHHPAVPVSPYANRSFSESMQSRETGQNIGGLDKKRASFDRGPPPLRSVSHALPPTSSRYAPQLPTIGQAQAAASKVPVSDPHSFQSTDAPMSAPLRSQTQSPGATPFGPKMPIAPIETQPRPASVNGPTSPTLLKNLSSPISHHGRSFSETVNYVFPTDGRETDPLQRWKGCPIFNWGFGGTIVTSFPKHVPRYATGHVKPMIKCAPGEVTVRSAKDICPLPERFVKFPGPLKGKSKKKDVASWLTDVIKSFEEDGATDPVLSSSLQYQEKVLLWKVLRSFIENDGLLEGNPAIESAVRKLLLVDDETDASENSDEPIGANISDMATTADSAARTEPVDPQAVDKIRKFLLKGKREDAIWHAVDKRLWAHALLIASTLSKDIWKQVVQEFVRQEVKNLSDHTEPLASLYDVFAGNWEESIDELVPPSARAGFQMVRTDTAGAPTKNALEGLNKWRESASLILSNRNPGDEQALLALARLLSSYNRTYAAHTCYMFARNIAPFGGVEDPHTCISLLSADHRVQPFDFARDLDSILLSEVYEYGLSLSGSSVLTTAPHLQSYKLYHAGLLAEAGYRTEAQSYCDAIAAAVKATTKLSPYFHPPFLSALDDLSKRLSRSPKDSSSSWISKPSMEKVSGSVWASFNRFVAGDEDDETSAKGGQGGGADVGPFARIAGDTPNVSPSASNINLSAAYPAASQAQSKYSPAGPYAPQMAPPQARPLPEQPMGLPYQPIRAASEITAGPYGAERGGGYVPQPLLQNDSLPRAPSSHYQPANLSPETTSVLQTTSSPVSQSQTSYIPIAPVEPAPLTSSPHPDAYEPKLHSELHSDYSAPSISYEPSVPKTSYEPVELTFGDVDGNVRRDEKDRAASSSYLPPTESMFDEPLGVSHDGGYGAPMTSSYEPPASFSSYEPPTSNSYEPPTGDAAASFEDEIPKEEPAEEKLPKKKSIMDDDDDDAEFTARAAAILKSGKTARDKENEEAFRKAAEADAKRDSKPQEKKGWFGSWFSKGGSSNESGGPIKAKLGEESSFYYDPDLKKWVNKKAGAPSPTPSATPPPPRAGPPSRAASANQATPPPPSLSAPPRPPLPGSTQSLPMPTLGPPSSLPNSRPPSRSPSSSVGPLGAASETPPLAPPLSSTGTPAPPSGPPSRPTTSMSNASSIDDLLGVPAPRKGGTMRKPKKGGRYIDVMAK